MTRARELAPDIVLMDLRIPGITGIEATRRITEALPATRVIVLTTFEDQDEILSVLRAGATGYLLKTSPAEKLCEAIRVAARGGSLLEPSVAATLIQAYANGGAEPPRAACTALREPLSARETGVLKLLAEGRSNKEIAAALRLAEGTVKNHLSTIFAKLQVLDRTQAALRARDLGLM